MWLKDNKLAIGTLEGFFVPAQFQFCHSLCDFKSFLICRNLNCKMVALTAPTT